MMVATQNLPWWESSLIWDGVTTGGAGMTAPVFYGLSSGAVASNEIDVKGTALAGLLLVGGSTVGGLLGYGIFGSLRDKGWGPWKAGAATGLLGGLTTACVLVGMSIVTGRPLIPSKV